MIDAPSPVLHLDTIKGVRVYIKRDDLLHPHFGGNKWRKLKFHLKAMQQCGQQSFVSFGGPFSNHLYACAAFARTFDLHATLFVRGEADDPDNPVLQFVRENDAHVISMSRKQYAQRNTPEFVEGLRHQHPSARIIPEGGDSAAGVQGCAEIVEEVQEQLGFLPEYWVIPVGTGCTARGVLHGLQDRARVHGIACVSVRHLTTGLHQIRPEMDNFELDERFTFGGLAQWDNRLIAAIDDFEERYALPLDPVYTGKAWYALLHKIDVGEIQEGANVLFLHTGGMPGRSAFNYRYGNVLRAPPHEQPAQ